MNKTRVPIGKLMEIKSKFGGFFLVGNLGMGEIFIGKTKSGDGWMMYLQEKEHSAFSENRGFRNNDRRGNVSSDDRGGQRDYPQQQHGPPHDESPFPDEVPF